MWLVGNSIISRFGQLLVRQTFESCEYATEGISVTNVVHAHSHWIEKWSGINLKLLLTDSSRDRKYRKQNTIDRHCGDRLPFHFTRSRQINDFSLESYCRSVSDLTGDFTIRTINSEPINDCLTNKSVYEVRLKHRAEPWYNHTTACFGCTRFERNISHEVQSFCAS